MNCLPTSARLLIVLCLASRAGAAQDRTIFPPILPPKQIRAVATQENLRIDGRLDEAAWQRTTPGTGFFQAQPEQGKPLTFDTRVRVLYDRKFLYIGAFCPDSLGRRAVRVPDLRRDFEYFQNDLFGVSLDPFRDQRNTQSFQTNPFSAQRDLLTFDDNFYDRDWDGYWKVRTVRADSGWTAEIQIPWATLRYPKLDPAADSTVWGVNFVRITRRLNEQAYWSPTPQAYTVYRMPYAGLLTGLKPPPPSVNVRVQPYVLTDYSRQLTNKQAVTETFTPKVGGEIKWAINPYTVLDLTANTDFAQADADRQVQNLTRFSVLFPERRQFFLENASLFSIGDAEGGVTPFFSRRIGLSSPEAGSQPLPIDFGARLVSRSAKRSAGGLLVKQRGLNNPQQGPTSDTWFGVARYSQNFGKENRVGGLVTARYDMGRDSLQPSTNYTYSGDAFFRISQPMNYYVMVSRSVTSGAGAVSGWSVVSQWGFATNQWIAFLNNSLVTAGYRPGVGFVFADNLLSTNGGGYRIFRPSWRPKWLRQLDPGAFVNHYVRASDGRFQQAELETFPIYLVGVKGSVSSVFVVPTWQQLDEPFSPLGVRIEPGRYNYTRYRVNYSSDQSARFAWTLFNEFGRYYDGQLTTIQATARYSPVPQVSFALAYVRNIARSLGTGQTDRTTELITPNIRLALNPRLQLIGFYQKNTAVQRDVWNVRLAWEFQPLSFLYIVYNSNAQPQTNDALRRTDLNRQEQVIGKLTYLKQF